jgi:hypothetical protein
MLRFQCCVVVLLFVTSCGFAQDIPEFPKPTPDHLWLEQLVGTWELESECNFGPGLPAMTGHGEETVTSIGGFWITSHWSSQFDGAGPAMSAVMTLGYDAGSKKYIGTWVDSSSSHMWKYEGTLDETGKILTLNAEGPNPMQPGQMSQFRDITEITGDGERTMTSQMQMENGEWVTFMTGKAKRKAE